MKRWSKPGRRKRRLPLCDRSLDRTSRRPIGNGLPYVRYPQLHQLRAKFHEESCPLRRDWLAGAASRLASLAWLPCDCPLVQTVPRASFDSAVLSNRHNQHICAPPFSEKSAPVANPASSEESQATIEAISSGLPRRFMGMASMMRSSTSGRRAASMSVAM